MTIAIINGPNLNLLGSREPEIYGNMCMEEYLQILRHEYHEIQFILFQSNIEGVIIDKLHEYGSGSNGIILNAGGYTHTSVAIGDAVKAINVPVIEVHISNIMAREDFRHRSYISPHAAGCIFGFGLDGYRLAVEGLLEIYRQEPTR